MDPNGYQTPTGRKTPGRARTGSLINRVLLGPNHQKLHPSTKPFVKAFIVGYLFDVLPKVIGLLITKRRRSGALTWRLTSLLNIVLSGLKPGRLALSSGITFGGAKFIDGILQRQLQIFRERHSQPISPNDQFNVSFLSSSISSLAGISLLKSSSDSLSLTLFSLVRALDTAFWILHRKLAALEAFATPKAQKTLDKIAKLGDIFIFWISSWRVMWVWFYQPETLPISYVKWISHLSRMDHRLLYLLQLARNGDWVYGIRPGAGTPAETVSIQLAKSMNWPVEKVRPDCISTLPCTLVHGHTTNTSSCLSNTIQRWIIGWKDAMYIYLPVHFLPRLLFMSPRAFMQDPLNSVILPALKGSSRSATFLASFIASCWFGICFSRTLVVPKLPVTQQWIDSGFLTFVACGCAGWSLILENERRRGEIALYVGLRALYTVLHKLPFRKNKALSTAIERAIFALSTGFVTANIVHKGPVRGIIKGLLGAILDDWHPQIPPMFEKEGEPATYIPLSRNITQTSFQKESGDQGK